MAMKTPLRNRIKEHRVVRAGDLVRHELNWRRHPMQQRRMLRAILGEVGFARSLLVYELLDGRLKLIDGHLRADLDPDAQVTVEVLDVTDDEARKLLLTIDPLAALAEADKEVLAQLAAVTEADSDVLNDFWKKLAEAEQEAAKIAGEGTPGPEQFLILVQCRDEAHQVELLGRFEAEGLTCKALLS